MKLGPRQPHATIWNITDLNYEGRGPMRKNSVGESCLINSGCFKGGKSGCLKRKRKINGIRHFFSISSFFFPPLRFFARSLIFSTQILCARPLHVPGTTQVDQMLA